MSGVDLVVPCYNAQRTLRATIDSVLVQDAVDTIVVVDDGSTDDSLAIAQSYGERVAVLTGPNQGVARARNRGAAHGRSEWLLFLDSDDRLTGCTVARRIATALATEADVVICDWEDVPDCEEASSSPVFRRLDWAALAIDPQLAIATDVWAPPAAILYRRALYSRTGGFRDDLPPIEDARMLFDVARLGARITHSAHVGARYRIIADSLSRSDPARFWCRVLRNGQQIETAWREDDAFGDDRRRAVRGIYNTAARGLFRAGHPDFFAALAAQRCLGRPYPLHGRIAGPLVRMLGFAAARRLLQLAGRA